MAARGTITTLAVSWAIGQLGRERATIAGLARQFCTTWHAVWGAILPESERMAADESRFDVVDSLGLDEHIWHHVDTRQPGPKELTGMVDLTRDTTGRVQARLLDLVPGRLKEAYADWLAERSEAFRSGVRVAALDPFAGYKGAIDDQLDDAVAVVDASHIVKLGIHAVDEVHRCVQQQTLGRRGRKGDLLYEVQRPLRAGQENLTDRQADRPD